MQKQCTIQTTSYSKTREPLNRPSPLWASKNSKICIFRNEAEEKHQDLFLLFAVVAIWCNLTRRPAAEAAGRRVWLHQMATTTNKRNKSWCFSSASLRNINILLFFDAQKVEGRQQQPADPQLRGACSGSPKLSWPMGGGRVEFKKIMKFWKFAS